MAIKKLWALYRRRCRGSATIYMLDNTRMTIMGGLVVYLPIDFPIEDYWKTTKIKLKWTVTDVQEALNSNEKFVEPEADRIFVCLPTSKELTGKLKDEIEVDEIDFVCIREAKVNKAFDEAIRDCLLYTSPSPRDRTRSRMPSSA